MAKAFHKEILRSITQSAGRFAAIAIISLLGAGVYAGLRMSAPDMRIAGDEFYDGTNLYDISVMSTLGLDDNNLKLLGSVDGVTEVMPAYRADVMMTSGSSSYATCVESLPIDSARASDTSDGVHALSDDAAYLNRPILLEGAWPANASECVVFAGAATEMGIGIGDTLTIEKVSSGEGDDLFAKKTFTVSGLVNSPAYVATNVLGTTSLGTGSIELYAYVPEAAFADDAPYTVAYLTVGAAREHVWDTPAYEEAVDVVKKRVEGVAGEIAEERWADVHGDAQNELDDARSDYTRERADAEREIADAEAKLADARTELDAAASKLASGREELNNSYSQIASSEEQLASAEEEYAAGAKELAEQKAAFAEQEARLPELKEQRSQLVAGIAQAQEGVVQLEQAIEQAKASGAPPEVIAAMEAQLAQLQGQLDQLNAQLAQLDDGIRQIEAGRVAIDEAQKQLDDARAQLDEAHAQLEDGKGQAYAGAVELQSGESEYLDGEASYRSGLEELESEKAKAEEEFAKAEKELADAQKDVDDIEYPEVYVMDRSKNAGAASLSSDADGIKQIATFFPFMFFLVAALVSLTSMTRMVDEERMVIGTHKALGYGKASITSKYLIYGALASGVGAMIGIVLLGKLLPWFIMTSYAVTYAVPVFPTPIDAGITLRALALSVGVTVVATWGAAAASLRARPSELMLPRVPKAGKRIVLEHIKPLWSRMSFSHKVTARNLLRYKRRFFMAVVGVAGCTALLMVGFGLRDAIGGIVSNQYNELVNYDAVVRVDEDDSDGALKRVHERLRVPDVAASMDVSDFNMVAEGPLDDMRIEVVVPSNDEELQDFVTLRNRESGELLQLDEGRIVLTEKAANVLGLSVGDEVVLYDENDVGDKTGEGHRFVVGGIAENYLGHFAYMLPESYETAVGKKPTFDTVYVKLAGVASADGGSASGASASTASSPAASTSSSAASPKSISDELLAIEGVNTVSFVADKVVTYEDMLDVMNKLIWVVVLLSAGLAFVVLYNLTNINITERVREIATLKVLGFTRSEVSAYIFREIIVMAFIGALVGCVLGVPLTFYIAQTAETPQMMFGRAIEPASFVLSFVITMVFSAIVAISMRRKLMKVNMVESLKSVE